MGTVVLIPSYNPQEVLINLVKELHTGGMEVLVVNDGSSDEYKYIFDRVREYADVVEYENNRGKGHALKTGIRRLAEMGSVSGFVTADGDGQHTVGDILKIAQILEREGSIVLGTRNLSKDIPWRSRVGNDMSKITYTLVTGRYLGDNQSGLRGFPMDMAEWLLGVEGNHYEYEMNVLVKATLRGCPIIEVPIEVIYENDNSASHFKPLLDTARIQGRLLLGGLVPLIIYLAAAIGFYAVGRRAGLTAWCAVWSGALCLLHCAYSAAGFFYMQNKREAALSALRILLRHTVMGAAEAAMFVFTGNPVPCVLVPIILVSIIAYASGRFRKNRLGDGYEGRCKRACP